MTKAKVELNSAIITPNLDIYYIPSRYPNAYPSGAPVDKFDEEMAEEAVRFAAEINAFARK